MTNEQPDENLDQQPKPEPPHGGEQPKPDGTDWKAEARKWESRAKANNSAAEELDQLKQSQMTEAEKAKAKAEKLQKKVDEYESEKQRAQWRTQVSNDTGVPSDVLRGSTLEELQQHAEQLKVLLKPGPTPPLAFGAERQPSNRSASQEDWLRSQFHRK